jgi:hypothetical protein
MYQRNERKPHEEASLDHFRTIYQTLNPGDIAHRCVLPFMEEESVFALRIMGAEYLVPFPDFELQPSGAKTPSGYERILFLRYLCEGKYTEPEGRQLSYREIPWGEVYYRNFEGRCIQRFARNFGRNPELFLRVMESTDGLRSQRLDKGAREIQAPCSAADDSLNHLAYRFEFCTGFYMSFLLWTADEEFPPSAQILFDDNIPTAFTAEDIAVACEVAVDHLKDMAARLTG